MTKVSVIIPTYGNPLFLSETIQSVINQTLSEWELIIVDDNNPESESRLQTQQLVKPFTETDNRITYICHEHNKNGAAARNTGFAVAKGKYIALLDSDDLYMPERLEKCFNTMESAPEEIAGVYTGCEFRSKGKKYHTEINVKPGNFIVETLACTFMFCTGSNIFVRKCVVDELHGFDEKFLRHQDYEFLVRLFEKYSLDSIPEVLVVKNNEEFNLPDVNKQIAIKNQYLDKFEYIINSLPEKDQRYIYFWKNVKIAEGAMAQNKIQLANRYYREAKKFGHLTMTTQFRRIVYPLYNLIQKVWK